MKEFSPVTPPVADRAMHGRTVVPSVETTGSPISPLQRPIEMIKFRRISLSEILLENVEEVKDACRSISSDAADDQLTFHGLLAFGFMQGPKEILDKYRKRPYC